MSTTSIRWRVRVQRPNPAAPTPNAANSVRHTILQQQEFDSQWQAWHHFETLRVPGWEKQLQVRGSPRERFQVVKSAYMPPHS